jgi:predicted HAD superfamily hydrolase
LPEYPLLETEGIQSREDPGRILSGTRQRLIRKGVDALAIDNKNKSPLSEQEILDMKVQLELMKIQREIRLKKEAERKAKRQVFDTLFPSLADVPIGWLIVGVICLLFSLFTLII